MAVDKEQELVAEITRLLTEFAESKFASKALNVLGPIREGSRYRWRITSTRYKVVTVLAAIHKPLFGGTPKLASFEVYGTSGVPKIKPNFEDINAFLDKAELVPSA